MSKTSPSAGATTNLNAEVQAKAILLWILRQDGIVLSLTDHDARIAFDNGLGEIDYFPDDGMSSTAITSLFSSDVDELEVTAFIQSGAIELDDLISGRYDAAEIRVYMVDWDDLPSGAWKMRRGNIGKTDFDDGKVRFQLLGMIQKMHSATIVELISSACRVKKFGDGADPYPRCKITIEAGLWLPTTAYANIEVPGSAGTTNGTAADVVRPTTFNDRWFVLTTAGTTGGSEPSWDTTIGNTTADGTAVWTARQARQVLGATISSVTNHMQLVLTGYSGDAANGFFQSGWIIFNDGENLGIRKPIASWDLATKTVTLALPLNLLAQPGDSVTLIAGCDRLITTCHDVYDNVDNFRGDPYLRGKDAFFTFPDAPPA